MIISVILGILFCGSLGATLRSTSRGAPLLRALPALVAFALLLSLVPQVAGGAEVIENLSWLPSFGIHWRLRLDGLSLLMALLVTGIGALVVIYASGYFNNSPGSWRFYFFLPLFMGAMSGLVLSDDLILLFVFWEMTTILSFFLVGFNHENEMARAKAKQALLITAGGGLLLFAGLILLGIMADTFVISELAFRREQIQQHELLIPTTLLILAGAFTKSAQFPFHFWLPNAMAAPTPVSAYLHSATMVKAGLFLMIRLTPSLGGNSLWFYTLVLFGGATMLLAALCGLIYRDLKKILAYSTLAVLGTITMLTGLGTATALKAAVLLLVAHALYKAALFMVAGAVDHGSGTRDVNKLSGLRQNMPLTFAAAALAALSQVGLVPFSGFLAKEYLYSSVMAHEFGWILTTLAFVVNALLFVLAFKVGFLPFCGPESEVARKSHEVPCSMLAGPWILAVTGLAVGLLATPFNDYLLMPALLAVDPHYPLAPLKLWHGFNSVLLLSAATLLCGYLLYSWNRSLSRRAGRIDRNLDIQFDRNFGFGLERFVQFSKWQTRLVQNGSLRIYMYIICGTFSTMLLFMLLYLGHLPSGSGFTEVPWSLVFYILPMLAATLTACLSFSRLTTLLSLGVIGLGNMQIFMYFGAPDLALTQILVETLSIVIFMLVLRKLPAMRDLSTGGKRLVDAFFALGCGLAMTLLAMKAQNLSLSPSVSGEFARLSYLEAKGRNVVNVILVDFRALDTLGEVVVLVLAALGITVLLKRSGKDGEYSQ